jgi:phosphoribosylglycinamide formyltransferase 2
MNSSRVGFENLQTKMRQGYGSAASEHQLKALLLGSGELGKELAIEFQRLGIVVVACDAYANAPAMQVAHDFRVFNMNDAEALRAVVEECQPDLIVPEIEAIATVELVELEKKGFYVVPNARATALTMNREGIREFAAKELGLPTARYAFASTFVEFADAVKTLGFPCYVKPLMSSSGKGQSKIIEAKQLAEAWDHSQCAGRNGKGRVIVEAHVPFEHEITLLTVRSVTGTQFCDAIGHIQVEGDYLESWQPHSMTETQLKKAKEIAKSVTDGLGGFGLFGVELFLLKDGEVLFSEVSPRPHDTGLVTLCTQTQSEFALHACAVLGIPVTQVVRHSIGASRALKAKETDESPLTLNLAEGLKVTQSQVRIFGKPRAHKNRRMGVALCNGPDAEAALKGAREVAKSLGY